MRVWRAGEKGVAVALFVAVGVLSSVIGTGIVEHRPKAHTVDLPSGSLAASMEAIIPRAYRLAASVSLDNEPGDKLLPTDIALGADGTMYVADFTSHTVVVFNAIGTERERWRNQLGTIDCGVVFVPAAIDVSASGQVAILWYANSVADGAVVSGRVGIFVEIRTLDGHVTHILSVSEASDVVLFGDRVYLPHGIGIRAVTLDGLNDASRSMKITWTRAQPGSFDLLAEGRVARIRVDGTVHIETWNPHTDKVVALGGLTPVAIDAVGSIAHIVAVEPATSVVHHVQVDAEGRVLSDGPLSVPYVAAAIGDWPLSMAAQADGMAVVSANNDGLVVSRLNATDGSTFILQGRRPDGAQISEPSARGWITCGDGNLSLGTATDDGVVVYDHETQRLIGYDSQLTRLGSRTVVTALVSVDTAGPPGADLVMATTNGRLLRSAWDPSAAPKWDVSSPCAVPGRLALSGDHLVVACRADKRVQWHDAATGQLGREFVGSSSSELWPFDLAIFPDGEMVTTDLIEKRLQRFAADGTALDDVAAGYAVGPQFVAVVDQPSVGRMVLTSMWDDYLELRDLSTGNLLVRWPAKVNGGRIQVADVGIDAQLRVYVLDRRNTLYRFDPLPDPAPASGATPTPAPISCVVEGDKRAGPATVILGDSASVTLTLRADCPLTDSEGWADIVVVADNSGSMDGGATDRLRKALTDLSHVIDYERHRLGLVVFRAEAHVVSPLSHVPRDLGALINAPGHVGDGTDIARGLATARDHLLREGDPVALPIIVLVSDGNADPESSIGEAQRTKDAGIEIYVIGFGTPPNYTVLRQLASGPDHYFNTWTADNLYLMYTQLAHLATASGIGNLILRDAMSADVDLVADSAFPPASVGDQQVTWGRGVLPSTGITLSLKVRPLHTGRRIPTNREAVAHYTDADGAERQFVFPIPLIDVIAPTSTPTARSTDPPSATATRTPGPSTVFLPIVLREAPCQPELIPLDVMMVIDASNSMSGAKLAGAQTAAKEFVSLLHLRKDRIGLATFSTDAHLGIGLTTDGPQFAAAVDRIALSAGTRMDSGLALALGTMLASPRPEAKRAVVLLTDGRQDAEPQAALDAAAALRRAGIDLLAVGLGVDADLPFLEQLVDDKGKVRRAGDEATLVEVYRQLARELPCDRAMWWGAR